MGSKKKKQRKRLICLWIILVVLLFVLAFLIYRDMKTKKSQGDKAQSQVSEEQQSADAQKTPTILYKSEEIELYAFFPSDVINVDDSSEFVNGVASVEFKNISGRYLKECTIEIKAMNGETYEFVAEEIPADMEVIAFDCASKTVEENTEIEEVDCSTEESVSDNLLESQVEVAENEMEVTIKNIGDTDLSNIVVTCHCMMDDVSYGGSKYEYKVEKLAAGESTVIDAVDCYFGQAKVVHIAAE